MELTKSLRLIGRIMNRLTAQGIIKGYALIGGLSVSVWGLPRGTKDVDLLISLESIDELTTFCNALEKEGFQPKLHKGGITDPIPYLVKAFQKDVPIDMIIATKNLEYEAVENAATIDFKDAAIPVISTEYLIVMKLKAGGPRDLLDVQEILQMGNVDLKLLKALAKQFRADKKLQRIMKGL